MGHEAAPLPGKGRCHRVNELRKHEVVSTFRLAIQAADNRGDGTVPARNAQATAVKHDVPPGTTARRCPSLLRKPRTSPFRAITPPTKTPGRRGSVLTDRGISLGAPRGSPIPPRCTLPQPAGEQGGIATSLARSPCASPREKLRNTRTVVLRRRRQAAWRSPEVLRFPPAALCRGNEEPGMARDRERSSAKALALSPAELAS